MKYLRNALIYAYIAATIGIFVFISNYGDSFLSIGANSLFNSAVFLLLSSEMHQIVQTVALLLFCSLAVLFVVLCILAYKGRYIAFCIFISVDALISFLIFVLQLINDTPANIIVIDGVISPVYSAILIFSVCFCRKKEMETDVDLFLRKMRATKD